MGPAAAPVVRRVAAHEWDRVKDMRLQALRDEAAPIAYLETHADAAARPDTYWQERTSGAAAGDAVTQFVAITADDQWVASVTGLREEPGATDWSGRPIEHLQVHVVGVWVHPDHRGAGLLGRLVDGLEAWGRPGGIARLRLLVHEDNARAQAAYRKLGFTPTGVVVPLEAGNELEMIRPTR